MRKLFVPMMLLAFAAACGDGNPMDPGASSAPAPIAPSGPSFTHIDAPAGFTITPSGSSAALSGSKVKNAEVYDISLTKGDRSTTVTGLTVLTYTFTALSSGDYTATVTARTINDNSGHTGTARTTFTIANKQDQSLTLTAPTEAEFGAAPFTVSAKASSGLPVSITAGPSAQCSQGSVSLNATTGAYETTVTIAGAGDCVVTATQGGDATYNSITGSRTVTIAKAHQAISFAALENKKVGDPAITLSATGGASGNAVTFALAATSKGCSLGTDGTTLSITGATATGESCTVVASQAGNANYEAATPVSRSFSITKGTQAALTLSGMPTDRQVYGTSFTTLKVEGGSGTGAVTYAAGEGSACSVDPKSGAVTMTSGTGTCSVTATKAGDANYEPATSNTQSVAAAPKPISVANVTVADKVYDATTAATIKTGALAEGSIINNDDATLALSAAFADANAGANKAVAVTATLSGTKAGNYALQAVTGVTATITKRELEVSATAKDKVYDGTTAAEATVLLANRVLNDAVEGTASAATFDNPNVGTGKTVTVSGIALTGASADNYTLPTTSVTATASITARPVTVTADAKTKVYGDADPALTYQVTSGSLVSNDAFTGGLTRAAGENVGSYAISQNTLTISTNYALAFRGANLTITARPLTVTADPKGKIEGGVDPALTWQLTSGTLVGTDALSGALTRQMGETAGTYSILQGSLTAGTNYALHYVGATFTIAPNAKPVITSFTGPVDPVRVNGGVTVTTVFTDGDGSQAEIEASRNYTLTYDWGNGATATKTVAAPGTVVSDAYAYPAAGVYTVTVTLSDKINPAADKKVWQYVVVYDPDAGFVTGGGWINSPAGAYTKNPALSGKATFGFVSKYQKGATTPSGNTEFQFKAGNLNFKSISYDWLVISGPKAQYKGAGTINGQSGYTFILTANDGQVSGGGGTDRFRIKITDSATGAVVYDNQMADADDGDAKTPLGGGSIQIQSK